VTGPTDARPLKIRIADSLRDKIERGELSPGEQLPTLEELAGEFMCGLTAVRDAVELLRQQGLVISQRGLGSFVRQRATARRHGMERYSRSRWAGGHAVLIAEAAAQGITANQIIRELAEVPAPPEVARRLGIEPGTAVWARRRTTLIEGRPNQLADSYYTLDLVERVPRLRDEDTGPGGGFARIEEAGIRLDEIEEEHDIRMPTWRETSNLRLPEGTPVADLYRTTFDVDGRPVEIMHAVIAGDMVHFSNRFKIPD